MVSFLSFEFECIVICNDATKYSISYVSVPGKLFDVQEYFLAEILKM